MSRTSAETEWLLISEAVARLEAGMYGGRPEPKPIGNIKAIIKKSIEKSERRPSIGSGSLKEESATRIYEAIMQGEFSVFVVPASTDDETNRTHLQVPIGVLEQMITTRGGLPDRTVEPMRIFGKASIAPELLAALSTSALYVRRKEFEAWYEAAKEKRNWPSQRPHYDTPSSMRSRCKKNPIGRPSKQGGIHIPIAALVNGRAWSAEQNFIADLWRLLKSQEFKVSRQTVKRAVERLHRETGDPRYHCVDLRKQPDESVWGSFEELMERRRRHHQK
jgi:hypothetical protein